MHILFTNDDGIQSPALHLLAKAAVKRGWQATVCAPERQQSAASQGLTLFPPVFVSSVSAPAGEAFAVGGTPADCVRLGLAHLARGPVDLVISGINKGYNAASSVFCSGTVGAAREAALLGYRAMAVSAHHEAERETLEALAELVMNLAERLKGYSTPPWSVLNVNAPALSPAQWRGLRMCPLNTAPYRDLYQVVEPPRGQLAFWMTRQSQGEAPIPGSDWDLLQKGYVTCTMLQHIPENFQDCGDFLQDVPFEACKKKGNPL